MSETDRAHDIVVWGATGVAGRLVTEFLTEQYTPEDLALAIGGRNEAKLDGVAADLTADSDEWDDLPVLLGDATDPGSLRDLAANTEVVCTTVGPYTKYGTPLVDACVEHGTDYCDLTGEVNWAREIVDEYHDAAVDAEARIVHSCGYDSIPADLGTLLAQTFAVEEFGGPCHEVRIYVEGASGGVSGGTLASAAELFAAASEDPEVRKVLGNPYSLAPPGEREGVDPGEQTLPRKDPLRDSWTAPSPMAVINERVVRRSNALLDYPWGREFRCSEVTVTGDGPSGAATAGLVSGGLGLFTLGMSLEPTRNLLRKYVFPDPGEGPSEEQMEKGHFRIRTRGRGVNEDGPFTVDAVVGADYDPGYGGTARMLGESAMALLEDDTDSPFDGGVLTPASAIGTPLADRLEAVGFTASAGVAEED
jgi:short subunit dehydrogenase-like uncharacterized protein